MELKDITDYQEELFAESQEYFRALQEAVEEELERIKPKY